MSYYIPFSDSSKPSIEVEDGTTNDETPLKFTGYNEISYGENIAENFLHLLENFANEEKPAKAVQGQLWYNNDDEVQQLFQYNGESWIPVSGVYKDFQKPENPNTGDFWVDQYKREVFIYIDEYWILVGSDENSNKRNGIIVDNIVDKNEIKNTVLKINVNNKILAIISITEFVPKIFIPGFNTIKVGINLSKQLINGTTPLQFSGVSEKSKSLMIDGEEIPSGNVLRSDAESVTSHKLTVASDDGVVIGDMTKLSITIKDDSIILKNNRDSSKTKFQSTQQGYSSDVLVIDNNKIGINTSTPEFELDVVGKIKSTGAVIINEVTNSLTTNDGALVVRGGVGIQQNMNVRGDTTTHGNARINNMLPLSTSSNMGSSEFPFNEIYSRKFFGEFNGVLVGDIQGRASSASSLSNSTIFKISGSVRTVDDSVFNGSQNEINLNTMLNETFISDRETKQNTNPKDYLLFHDDSDTIDPVKKITVGNFISSLPSIPIGSVIPFAGHTPPVGWLLCDGSEYSIRDYQSLYNVIGNLHDGGNPRLGRFKIPDLRGRVPFGSEFMNNSSLDNIDLGQTGGSNVINLEPENIPDHSHSLTTDTKEYYVITEIGESNEPHIEVGTPWYDDDDPYPHRKRLYVNNETGITGNETSQPVNIQNEHIKINYIIYTGRNF